MKTVFYKFAGFVFTDEAVHNLATRMIQKTNNSYVDDPERRLGFDVARILQDGRKRRAALGFPLVYWPDGHPNAKFGHQWILIVRPEPSLTESLNNFTEVPLVPDEEEEDKRAVEWLKEYGYTDKELQEMWMTAPRKWIFDLDDYPLHY